MDNNTRSVYVRRLREKIEDDPSHPQRLFAAVLCFGAALPLLVLAMLGMQRRALQAALVQNYAAVAGSLLAAGVPEYTVAQALQSTTATAAKAA